MGALTHPAFSPGGRQCRGQISRPVPGLGEWRAHCRNHRTYKLAPKRTRRDGQVSRSFCFAEHRRLFRELDLLRSARGLVEKVLIRAHLCPHREIRWSKNVLWPKPRYSDWHDRRSPIYSGAGRGCCTQSANAQELFHSPPRPGRAASRSATGAEPPTSRRTASLADRPSGEPG